MEEDTTTPSRKSNQKKKLGWISHKLKKTVSKGPDMGPPKEKNEILAEKYLVKRPAGRYQEDGPYLELAVDKGTGRGLFVSYKKVINILIVSIIIIIIVIIYFT